MSLSTIESYAFEWNDPKLIDCFVDNGLVIAKSILDPKIIKKDLESMDHYFGIFRSSWTNLVKFCPQDRSDCCIRRGRG